MNAFWSQTTSLIAFFFVFPHFIMFGEVLAFTFFSTAIINITIIIVVIIIIIIVITIITL